MIKKTTKNKVANKIFVTSPSLPKLDSFIELLKTIWDSKELTNNGPYHKEFEQKLAEHLGVKHISLFSNGTLGLMTALQTLNIKGEVITTPFTFVATPNSLIWNNLTPVFCDIDPVYGNIDPYKIESLITEKTTAIMPVHVYGNPCDVEKIQNIAEKHKLKVIYDAAHAFDVKKSGKSILNFGDLSVLSFHATKAFNTIEGGAIISHSIEVKNRIDNLKNFGITDEVTVVEPGINGKMNELQSAFGILQLKEIDKSIRMRKEVALTYDSLLKNVKGIRMLVTEADIVPNYSYYPIFINSDYRYTRDELYEKLKAHNIYTRRYFYPLVTSFKPYSDLASSKKENLANALNLSEQVLCLPIYSDLPIETASKIVQLIKEEL